ncbi:urea carboxylase-associated family protein [Halobacterium yunchengense]|uniref:urea carboxylase-associated family protein n=1 Tax=Halobacterium yunchengense TaxID=3108497 RepID=UPI00300931E9
MLTQRIPEKRGLAFEVAAGDAFEVVDPEGQQVADLVAFDAGDPTVRFSTKYSYRRNGKVRVTDGDTLYATDGGEILSITADDCGVHDLLYAPCNEWVLEDYYDQPGENGCRENLGEAIAPLGVDESLVLDTLNVFMKSTIAEQTYVDIREPPSEPGDTVRFRAERDCYVAVSSCAGESVVNAGETNPIDVRVPDGTVLHKNF